VQRSRTQSPDSSASYCSPASATARTCYLPRAAATASGCYTSTSSQRLERRQTAFVTSISRAFRAMNSPGAEPEQLAASSRDSWLRQVYFQRAVLQ
jgi:hypothetical protein